MSTAEPRADRNKRIALEAIAMLERIATDYGLRAQEWAECELGKFRARWAARGVEWVNPPQLGAFDLDRWVHADEMAEYADVKPDTVRRWAYRGHITTQYDAISGRPLYNIGECVAYQAKRAADKR